MDVTLILKLLLCSGPKEITVGDFWRMIWQEGANRIVMVANVEENGKVT